MKSTKRRLQELMNTNPTSVNVDELQPIALSYVQCDNGKIALLEGNASLSLDNWVRNNLNYVQNLFEENYALLFRGFSVNYKDDFANFTKHFSPELLEYNEPSTPRSKVSGNVYTSTEYPKEQHIPLHNEHSYTNNWPKKLWFYCAKAAEKGGQTPIVDSRLIYRDMDPKIREEFINKGIMYVRNYSDQLDLSWQHVFQTEDTSEVELFLRKKGVAFEWKSNGVLCTKQKAQVVIDHSVTGEPVWFNQAHLFHVSNLQPEIKDYLINNYGISNIPRNVYFADGTEIPESYLEEIRSVYKKHQLVFDWQVSDVLMLDNEMFAHGRNPFEGSREVLVAMADPTTTEQEKHSRKNSTVDNTRKKTANFFINNTTANQSNEVLKYKLAASYRMMVSEKLDEGGISGHISLRVPDQPENFWVNPFGLLAEEVNLDNLIMVDKKGNIVEGEHPVNVAGFCIHSAIHDNHPDVNCVVHTHSPWGTLFSALNKELLPIDQNCCMFYEDHAIYDEYNGPVNDEEDALRIAKKIKGKSSLILQNHGTITCARTIEEAVIKMVAIERAYRLNILSLDLPNKKLIDPDTARTTRDWIGNEIGLSIEFNALLRKVEKIYPDLFAQKPSTFI